MAHVLNKRNINEWAMRKPDKSIDKTLVGGRLALASRNVNNCQKLVNFINIFLNKFYSIILWYNYILIKLILKH